MSSRADYVKRIIALDSTHNREYSLSVAASLISLERRYEAVTTIETDRDNEIPFEYIEGKLGSELLPQAYKSFREGLFAYLRLAEHDISFHQEKELISRLQEKLPLQFPEKMDKRAYHWEILEGALVDGKETRRLFPLHYVSMLVWRALHDNEAFRHNYADNSLEKAQSDLRSRLLTFYKTLDENIQKKTCSHGARNALVLCLNKIHPDVDLIEDIETALNAEFCRLLSERLSDRLATHSPSNPDKVLHDALLAWIKDDNGELVDLTALLRMDEALLHPFLQQHGLLSYEKLQTISRYQNPSLLMMPKHQGLVDALLAAYYFINVNALRIYHNKPKGICEKPDTLSLLIKELDNPNTLVLFDEAWQKRLILSGKLYQLVDFLKHNQRNLVIIGALTEQAYAEVLARVERHFDECLGAELSDIPGIMHFAESQYAEMEQSMGKARKAFIENFFAYWAVASAELYERQPLYAFLWEPDNKKYISLSDEVLQGLKPLGDSSEVEVASYELNRIFLHGLITPVSEWSSLFTSFFEATLSLIDGSSNQAFKQSYPEDLRQALNALLKIKQGEEMALLPTDILWHPDSSLPLQTISQLVYIMLSVTSKELAFFLKRIKLSLPELIKTADDFLQVMYYLNSEQIMAFYKALKTQLPELIQTAEDFGLIISYLNPEQITAFCETFKTELPRLIKTADDFLQVMYYLNSEQIMAFCKALKTQLPELIQTAKDFDEIMPLLEPEQITAFCKALKTELPRLIKTVDDFYLLISHLDSVQRMDIYEALKTELPGLIKTVKNFVLLMYTLNLEQRKEVYEALETELPGLIQTADDFDAIMLFLEPEQKIALSNILPKPLSADGGKTENRSAFFSSLSTNKVDSDDSLESKGGIGIR